MSTWWVLHILSPCSVTRVRLATRRLQPPEDMKPFPFSFSILDGLN
jgi:hypothetical protein